MENGDNQKELIIDGSGGKTFVCILKDSVSVYTKEDFNEKYWTGEEIYKLLEDGRKYRLLKKAEEIKKKMLTE